MSVMWRKILPLLLFLLSVITPESVGKTEDLTVLHADVFEEKLPREFDVGGTIDGLVADVNNRLTCPPELEGRDLCKQCLKTGDLLPLLQVQRDARSLSEKKVKDLSILLLYHISNFPTLCTDESKKCGDFAACRNSVIADLQCFLINEAVEHLLYDLHSKMKPGSSKECFSTGTILQEMANIPYSTYEDRIEKIMVHVMKHLFRGECIILGEIENVSTDFLDDIFYMYGDKCSSVINMNGLKKIINDLQSKEEHGQDNHKHDHSNHDHSHDETEDPNHDCEHIDFAHHLHHIQSRPNDGSNQDEPHDINDHDHDHSNHFHYHHNSSDHDHDHHNHSHAEHEQTIGHKNGTKQPTNSSDVAKKIDKVFKKLFNDDNSNGNRTQIQSVTDSATVESSSVKNIYLVGHTVVTASATFVAESGVTDASANVPDFSYHEASQNKTVEVYLKPDEDRNESAGILHHESAGNPNTTHEVLTESSVSGTIVASAMRSEFFHQDDDHSGSNGINLPTLHSHKVYLSHAPLGSLHEHGDEEGSDHHHHDHDGHHHHHHISLASKCLSPEDLIKRYGRAANSSLTKADFAQLCPALIQQVVSGVCKTPSKPQQKQPSPTELYGYSTLAVFLISLTSFAGIILLPILTKNVYLYVMAACIGLSFSTLIGDALLHLLPQALGVHSHNGDSESHNHEDDTIDPMMWKQLSIFIAIYGLFIFEAIVNVCTGGNHSHGGHGHSHIPETLPKEITLVSIQVKSDSNAQLATSPDRHSSSLDTEIAEVDAIKKPNRSFLSSPTLCGLSTVALLVTLGDSIHNFGDGLAIGASFSSSLRSGLSTSIAVFCHELPHEFGDFVILLSSGLSFPKALWLNFLSSITCFIGLYIGIQIGVNETARLYIMAITSGIFLYVALVEMLPELKETTKGNPIKMLLAKNIGIFIGIAIMVLISIYEHRLYM